MERKFTVDSRACQVTATAAISPTSSPGGDGRAILRPKVGAGGDEPASGRRLEPPACRAAPPAPCPFFIYNSNNVIGDDEKSEAVRGLASLLSPYHRRQAYALFDNVRRLLALAPSLGCVGFLTLTTPDNCTDAGEFRERWRSFQTNFFSGCPEFGHWLAVYERQRRGAWHLHLLVIVAQDIRSGVVWDEIERGIYRSASPYLRALWALLRERCVAFGFGRHELLPVRSGADAMARYVGKYVGKHMGARKDEDKGKRLVSASRGWPRSSAAFAWNTDGARAWRRNLGRLAAHLGLSGLGGFAERYGVSWAYHLAEVVRDVDRCLAIDAGRLDRILRARCGIT